MFIPLDKLTKEQLCNPTFEYVHYIFKETMGISGFGQGLFKGAELDCASMTDHQQKRAWLNKLIILIKSAGDQELDVSPDQILAGLEPEKTNILL